MFASPTVVYLMFALVLQRARACAAERPLTLKSERKGPLIVRPPLPGPSVAMWASREAFVIVVTSGSFYGVRERRSRCGAATTFVTIMEETLS